MQKEINDKIRWLDTIVKNTMVPKNVRNRAASAMAYYEEALQVIKWAEAQEAIMEMQS